MLLAWRRHTCPDSPLLKAGFANSLLTTPPANGCGGRS